MKQRMWISCLLTVLIFGVLCHGVLKYCFPFLWAEHLLWANFVEKSFAGQLGLADLFEPFANHLYVLPRLVTVSLAWCFAWNPVCEVLLSLFFGAAFFGMVALGLRRSYRAIGRPFPWGLLPVLAVMIFSFNQSGNWMWPFQMPVFLSLFLEGLGFYLITRKDLRWFHLGFAMSAGVLAALSWGSGLAFWPSAWAILLHRAWHEAERRAKMQAGVWLLGCLGMAVFYLLCNPAILHGGAGPTLTERLTVTVYFVPLNVGANMVPFQTNLAMPLGCVALAFGLWAQYQLFQQPRRAQDAALFFSALMIFSVVVSALIGFSLAGQADDLNTPSYGSLLEGALLRYGSLSQCYWIGVIFFLAFPSEAKKRNAETFDWSRMLPYAVLACICLCSLRGSRTGRHGAQERYRLYMPLVRQLVVEELPALPTRLQWPYGRSGEEELAILRKRELSIFRPGARSFWENNNGESNF
jgi:hypothetical protein